MSYTNDENGKINLDRQRRHAGEEHICDKCGGGGVVGYNLAPGTQTIQLSPVLRSMFGSPPPRWYWIHETCVQEQAPLNDG